MRKITEEEIAQEFDARTFSKGVEYFEKGCVGVGVKKGNELAGTVYGSAPQPYKVRVEITDHI
ncbi:MAG: SWIM zinc finger family protein, partial [Candidatus Freyarchaeota archaeon]